MGSIEKLIKKMFYAEDTEKVLVTLTRNGQPEIEPLDRGHLSEEMGRRILADINDLHIPSYFENGKGAELVRINYLRRKKFFMGKSYASEIMMGEPHIEYETQ